MERDCQSIWDSIIMHECKFHSKESLYQMSLIIWKEILRKTRCSQCKGIDWWRSSTFKARSTSYHGLKNQPICRWTVRSNDVKKSKSVFKRQWERQKPSYTTSDGHVISGRSRTELFKTSLDYATIWCSISVKLESAISSLCKHRKFINGTFIVLAKLFTSVYI